jgi:hypothetical protein
MTSSSRRLAKPIAVRRFSVAGEPGHEVVLTIGKPRPENRPGGDWYCWVLIEGIPRERRQRVKGLDAIQALQLAMEYARRELDASGRELTWLNDLEPGDIGLPFFAPAGYGFWFQRRCERWLERQVHEMSAAVTAIVRERARRRASRTPPKT